jgi:acyl-coenzyme A synthetase/AMP-(fatty) acid ligase
MGGFHPPTVVTKDRTWSADELAGLALRWRSAALRDLIDRQAPVALAMAHEPGAIALFLALSTLPAPMILLPRDPRGWNTSPPLPAGTPLILLPTLAAFADRGRALGLDVRVVPEVGGAGDGEPVPFLASPGIVLFTSGSTGPPKPVFRRMVDTIDNVRYRIKALGLSASSNVVGSLPLDRSAGFSQVLLLPILLGSRLALVDSADYSTILRFFATREYAHWTGTPALADVLVRAARARPTSHDAPYSCLSAGRVSERLFDAFLATFGVPLRGYYGATEMPWIAADTRPASEVRADVAGLVPPVVAVRIGDRPATPAAPGESGRLWIKSPWGMVGYGFPPDVEARVDVDGWWGTPDVARVEADGSLVVIGRVDDVVRTGAGNLVNLGHVTAALGRVRGVRGAIAVPVETATGVVIGALAEVDQPSTASELRAHLEADLPFGLLPRVIETIDSLPRLADGRPDRLACIALLEDLLGEARPIPSTPSRD